LAISEKKDYTFTYLQHLFYQFLSCTIRGIGKSILPEAVLKVYTVLHIHFTGQGIGKQSASGIARIIKENSDWQDLPQNPIIIVTATTSEMIPYLQKVKGIIAEQPGLTSHAAVVSRELGIPAIVDVHDATQHFQNGQTVTMDCVTGKISVGTQKAS
jgi:pyruvate kinase